MLDYVRPYTLKGISAVDNLTTREKLLKKGFDLFLTQGYNATGIQEITDAVNVSKGSFYNHFKKKEKFAVELIESFANQLAYEHHLALSNKKLKPLKRIEKFYFQKIKSILGRGYFLNGCIISNMCQEVAGNSDLFARVINKAFEGMRGALENCLDEAKADGAISVNTNTGLLAEFILNSWNGALMRVKASRNSKAFDAFKKYLQTIGE